MIKKYISIFSAALLLCAGTVSCIGDLDVMPIDPTITLPDDVLDSEDAYASLLAKCYAGLTVSASEGPDGAADIDGIDGGYGQYLRALFYMNEYTTDEAVCPWNDQTLYNIHGLSWTTSDVFVTAMFSRIYYQIGLCNEFLRRSKSSSFRDSQTMKTYEAEARALRALSYLHAIDMFGNVPFATEANSVGSTGPDRISRANLFKWLDKECDEMLAGSDLKEIGANVYGRLDKGFVMMIQAKLNLNAAVYLGISDAEAKEYFNKAGTLCKDIKAKYPALHETVEIDGNSYHELFMADNDKWNAKEIIFCVPQDGNNIQSYGGTTFLIKAAIKSGEPEWMAAMGVNDGWGGINVTPEFIKLFGSTDSRNLLWGGGPNGDFPKDLADFKDFTSGWSAYKFSNLRSDGQPAQAVNFPDTDFPLFRTADAYLMLAEAQLRGASTVTEAEGRDAWTKVRKRAGIGEVTNYNLDELLNERGRELYWECWRRSDLVRFGKFTSKDYLWAWKGGVYEGTGVDEKFNLMPIPANEINSNDKLIQNPGY